MNLQALHFISSEVFNQAQFQTDDLQVCSSGEDSFVSWSLLSHDGLGFLDVVEEIPLT